MFFFSEWVEMLYNEWWNGEETRGSRNVFFEKNVEIIMVREENKPYADVYQDHSSIS